MAAVEQVRGIIEEEEGECSDSEDEKSHMGADIIDTLQPTKTGPMQMKPNMLSDMAPYRSSIPQILINSDSDATSDEDEPSFAKRIKSRIKNFQDQSMDSGGRDSSKPFVNPMLQSQSSSISDSIRPNRKNSIWGSVLTEQVLTHDIKGFGVDDVFDQNIGGRDVESYDFRKAKEDDRPVLDSESLDIESEKEDIFGQVVDLEGEVRFQERQKRKRKMRDRLGKVSYDKIKACDLKVTENSETSDVVKAITEALNERNIELFTRIVETLGNGKALELFHQTEKVEDAGGMLTFDGYRRRTAGGVYIQLLKTEELATKEQVDYIFGPDQKKWQERKRELRKIKRAARKKWLKEKKGNGKKEKMDWDRPDTSPSSINNTEDLEVLDVIDSHNNDENDFDAADLPERPATPEPKDVSSDGECKDDDDDEEEDDDEDDDISVAIAKAKAAILKRQRQQNAKNQDENSDMIDDQRVESKNMNDS